MLTNLARSFAIVAALMASGFMATTASAENVNDSGSFEGSYVKREMSPIADQDGHVLLLTESKGKSSNPNGLIDGFATTVHEIADLTQGNGTHQGYVIYTDGSDQEVVKFDGMVSTTIKDGKPSTTMKGDYVLVGGTGTLAGIEGQGTYSGYFTAEDKFHVDWEGSRTQPTSSMARSQ